VNNPDGAFVAGAVENAGELGLSMVRNRWEASLRLRHLGDYPLIEDDSIRADAEDTLNLRGAWKAEHLTIYLELLNALDDAGKDVVYYYATHVAGLDPPGEEIEGRVSRIGEPRTLRLGVKYRF